MPEENINETLEDEGTVESTVNIDENKYIVINAPNAQKIVSIHEEGGQEGLLPSGGTTGQILAKASDTDFDATWSNLPSVNEVPSGGTEGQVLTKTENGYDWEDASSGESDWTLYSSIDGRYILPSDLPQAYNQLKIVVSGLWGDIDRIQVTDTTTSGSYESLEYDIAPSGFGPLNSYTENHPYDSAFSSTTNYYYAFTFDKLSNFNLKDEPGQTLLVGTVEYCGPYEDSVFVYAKGTAHTNLSNVVDYVLYAICTAYSGEVAETVPTISIYYK